MVAMLVMQAAIDEIVDVIAMGDGFMAATRPVDVARLVTLMAVLRRALIRVRLAHLDDVLVDAVAVRVVQMAVMQIVDMVAMAHGRVPAIGPVIVRMLGLGQMVVLMVGHCASFIVMGVVGFASMVDRVLDEVQDMSVAKRIEDRLTLPPALHQAGRVQDLQARRNRAELVAAFQGEIRDGPFPVR